MYILEMNEEEKEEFEKDLKEVAKGFRTGCGFMIGVTAFIMTFLIIQYCSIENQFKNPNSNFNKKIEKDLNQMNREFKKEMEINKRNAEIRERKTMEEIKAKEELKRKTELENEKKKKGTIIIKESK